MASTPGPGGSLYVLVPGPGATVLARLDGSGVPAPGWPISLPASSGCWLFLPVDDGSVRVVRQTGDQIPDGTTALWAFAFDATGRSLPGWPVELPCCVAGSLVGRVIGDTMTLFQWGSDGDLAEGALVSVAPDGTVRNGERATYPYQYEQRWAIGPDGVAYGSINQFGDSPEALKSAELLAVSFAGARAEFPIAIDGLASEPSFDAAGRIHVTVTTGTQGPARTRVFDTGGHDVVGGSGDLGIVPSDACSGIEGSCEVPAAPLVGADGTTYAISVCCDGTTVVGISPSGEVMAGWPYRSVSGYEVVGEVTIVAHWPAGFWAGGGKQMAGWEFPLPLTAAALAVALIGNGAWSVDRVLNLTYPDWLTPAWIGLMLAGDIALLAIRASRKGPAAQ